MTMEWLNWLLALLTLIAGGGWLFDRKRHRQDIEIMQAEIKRKDMELAKLYVDEFKENIVEPMRKEVVGLRREVKNLKNAILKINDCPHHDDCPVYDELQKQQNDDDRQCQGGGCA